MPKIKNWSRREKRFGESSSTMVWEHDEQPVNMVIEDVRGATGAGPDDNWEAYLNFRTIPFEEQTNTDYDRTFRDKEDARKAAVRFMKRNPRIT